MSNAGRLAAPPGLARTSHRPALRYRHDSIGRAAIDSPRRGAHSCRRRRQLKDHEVFIIENVDTNLETVSEVLESSDPTLAGEVRLGVLAGTRKIRGIAIVGSLDVPVMKKH